MENEKLIIDILQQIQNDIKELKSDVSKLKVGQEEINKDISAIKEQTVILTEFKNDTSAKLNIIHNEIKDVKQDIYHIEQITGKNLSDIAKLKSVK